MNLTKKSSYGLIATLELAAASDTSPQSATRIAKRYSLPVSFIEKILHELRHAGIVNSKQGRTGGYFLARAPEDISVRDVLEAIDNRFKGLLDSLSLQSLLHSELEFSD
jgi:Rrf2 family protein